MRELDKTVCLVTGGTSGIGHAAAVALAAAGADVTIVGRNQDKTREVVDTMRRKTGNTRVAGIVGDLSRPAEVRRIAGEFRRGHDQLHVLLNNAGAFVGKRMVTGDGMELTFALNHLAYFVLSLDLLELLKASAPARIVNVSSGAQSMGRMDFDDIMGEKGYSGSRAYSQSKLANVMFTADLARRLEGTGVTVNCLHPGVVRTNFSKENSTVMMKVMVALMKPFFRSPKKGAETAVWLATSPDVQEVTGKYFADKVERAPNPLALDERSRERLWRLSEGLTAAG